MKKFLHFCGVLSCLCVFYSTDVKAGSAASACYGHDSCGVNMYEVTGSTLAIVSSGGLAIPGFQLLGLLGMAAGTAIFANRGKSATANEYLKLSNGLCLECDSHQVGEDYECPNMTYAIIGDKTFQCHVTGTGDYWSVTSLPVCNGSEIQKSNVSNSNDSKYKVQLVDSITNGGKKTGNAIVASGAACLKITCNDGYTKDSSGDCVKKVVEQYCESNINGKEYKVKVGGSEIVDYKTCSAINSSADKNGEKFTLACGSDKKFTCSLLECKNNYTADGEKCKSNWTVQDCINSRPTPEGKACCKLGNQTFKFDSATNKCPCKKGEFKMLDPINAVGACVEGGKEPEKPEQKPVTPQCDTATGARLNAATNTCVCGVAEMHLNADGISCSCDDTNKEYKGGKCQYTAEYMLAIKRKEITEIRARLDKIMSGLKVSVWKDEEGNFNTARLASDSIAGVVLGTVGGVVTSKVVKKNQLKKGFEAIQCSIGGQSVADYGDEFVVGLGGM